MDDERGWRIVRVVAAVTVALGSLALAALLFIIGMVFAHPVFGGTPVLQAVLVAASLCCLAACFLVTMRATGTDPGWAYPVAAAALVLAAALVVMSGIAEPKIYALPLCLLALVTPWWAPR